jgi:hypothetical protein
MGGGLMQLVAYGAQDVYLSGNPQITFFKVVYRRHTNFSVEAIQQTWNGAADFGRTVTCNINRNGDLITNMYVAVELNAIPVNNVAWGYVSRIGHAMIESVKIEIGGSKIDEQYGDWLNIWYELTHKSGQVRGYSKLIGDVPELKNVSVNAKPRYQLYVPLQFWFNRNNGLALPLIALQYHDVRVTLKFLDTKSIINYEGINDISGSLGQLMKDSYLLIDYVYLDSEERKRFAQASHEYLIEQLQFTGSETLTTQNKFRLNFNHPSKYLVWAPHLQQYANRASYISYAFDNDWRAARDRFAKILAGACSTGLAYSPATSVAAGLISVNAANAATGATSVTVAGDVIEPSRTLGVSNVPADILSKIEVKFVVQAAPTGTASPIAVNAIGDSASVIAKSFLDNSIVTRNDLSMADISVTLPRLLGSLSSSSPIYSFLNLFNLNVVNYFNYGNYIDGSDNPVYQGKLQLNGHDRFQVRDGHYFNYVQPFQHFSNTPADGINVYSFALKPEDHQPTGSCNFSRIDNATLQVDLGYGNNKDDGTLALAIGASSIMNIYTVNYNVLRVMSGMAGTAYSN